MKFNRFNAFAIGLSHLTVAIFMGINIKTLEGQCVASAFAAAAGITIFALAFIFSNPTPGEPVGETVKSNADYKDRKVFTGDVCNTVTVKTLREWKSGKFAIDDGIGLGWVVVNGDGTVPDKTVSMVKTWWE